MVVKMAKKLIQTISGIGLIALLSGCAPAFFNKAKTMEFPYNTSLDNKGNIVYTITVSADPKLQDIVEQEVLGAEQKKLVDVKYLMSNSDFVFRGKYNETKTNVMGDREYELFFFNESKVYKHEGRIFTKPVTPSKDTFAPLYLAGITRASFDKEKLGKTEEYIVFANMIQLLAGKGPAMVDCYKIDSDMEDIITKALKQQPKFDIYDSQISK